MIRRSKPLRLHPLLLLSCLSSAPSSFPHSHPPSLPCHQPPAPPLPHAHYWANASAWVCTTGPQARSCCTCEWSVHGTYECTVCVSAASAIKEGVGAAVRQRDSIRGKVPAAFCISDSVSPSPLSSNLPHPTHIFTQNYTHACAQSPHSAWIKTKGCWYIWKNVCNCSPCVLIYIVRKRRKNSYVHLYLKLILFATLHHWIHIYTWSPMTAVCCKCLKKTHVLMC